VESSTEVRHIGLRLAALRAQFWKASGVDPFPPKELRMRAFGGAEANRNALGRFWNGTLAISARTRATVQRLIEAHIYLAEGPGAPDELRTELHAILANNRSPANRSGAVSPVASLLEQAAEYGASQKEIAFALGVHTRTLRRWAHDGAPSETHVEQLALEVARLARRGATPSGPDLSSLAPDELLAISEVRPTNTRICAQLLFRSEFTALGVERRPIIVRAPLEPADLHLLRSYSDSRTESPAVRGTDGDENHGYIGDILLRALTDSDRVVLKNAIAASRDRAVLLLDVPRAWWNLPWEAIGASTRCGTATEPIVVRKGGQRPERAVAPEPAPSELGDLRVLVVALINTGDPITADQILEEALELLFGLQRHSVILPLTLALLTDGRHYLEALADYRPDVAVFCGVPSDNGWKDAAVVTGVLDQHTGFSHLGSAPAFCVSHPHDRSPRFWSEGVFGAEVTHSATAPANTRVASTLALIADFAVHRDPLTAVIAASRQFSRSLGAPRIVADLPAQTFESTQSSRGSRPERAMANSHLRSYGPVPDRLHRAWMYATEQDFHVDAAFVIRNTRSVGSDAAAPPVVVSEAARRALEVAIALDGPFYAEWLAATLNLELHAARMALDELEACGLIHNDTAGRFSTRAGCP
jgi:hypothetical protein